MSWRRAVPWLMAITCTWVFPSDLFSYSARFSRRSFGAGSSMSDRAHVLDIYPARELPILRV